MWFIDQEPSSNKPEQENSSSPSDFEHILVTQDAGLKTITFNRPTKYNALNHKVIPSLENLSQKNYYAQA